MHSLNIAQNSLRQRLVQAVDKGLEVWVVKDVHFATSRSSVSAVVDALTVQCPALQAAKLGDQRFPLASSPFCCLTIEA